MSMNFLLLQVIAFSDEDGVRFQSTFLGSAALAGVLLVTALQISDEVSLNNFELISTHDSVYYQFIHA